MAQARLLVDAGQVGAVLGRGGEAVGGVRRSSGAHVRVADARREPADVPPSAARDDSLVTVRARGSVIMLLGSASAEP